MLGRCFSLCFCQTSDFVKRHLHLSLVLYPHTVGRQIVCLPRKQLLCLLQAVCKTKTGQLSTVAVLTSSFMRHCTCRSRKTLGLSVGFVWNLHGKRSRCLSRVPWFAVGRSQTASGRATPQQHDTCHSRKLLGSSLAFVWNLQGNKVKVLVKSALTCCRQITDSFRKSYALLWRFRKVCLGDTSDLKQQSIELVNMLHVHQLVVNSFNMFVNNGCVCCRQITDSFRKSYALLWQSLIFADAEGIKKHSQAMNAGDMYPLFAGMLTNRPWDEVSSLICPCLLCVNPRHTDQVHWRDRRCSQTKRIGSFSVHLCTFLNKSFNT